MILAGLGLGSAGLSRLMLEQKWALLPMTFLLLGTSGYLTFFVNRNSPTWRKWLLLGATGASSLILSYSFLVNP